MIAILYQSRVGSDNDDYGSLISGSGPYSSKDPDAMDCLLDPIVDDAPKVRVCVEEFDVTNRQNCNAPGTNGDSRQHA
jgi:hypothetical protein